MRWACLVVVTLALLCIAIFLIAARFGLDKMSPEGGGFGCVCMVIGCHLIPCCCCMGDWFTLGVPFLLLLGGFLAGWMVSSLPWPNNPDADIFDHFVRAVSNSSKSDKESAPR